ncbi:serine protease [Photobacterium sp. SDRW27]|uniref:S1 family peptidase n=1 Tax=Photobacterium obscurum TaxID=2829490 RepID=UPI0022445D90|nr:serine protease [Photobacterium obscurum]MCW8328022.1 serine protease [Photobacterium obscurum]
MISGVPFLAIGSEGQAIDAKIIGGIPAAENELPWQAYLNMTFPDGSGGENTFLCGGVVVSENVVLTAAHCVRHDGDTVTPSNIKVWAGIIHVFSANNLNTISVSEIIVHPSYNSSRFANDIAIIKLDSALPDGAKPLRMADRATQSRADNAFANGWVENGEREPNLLVSGWGTTVPVGSGQGSTILQHTLLSGVPDSICGNSDNWGSNIRSSDYPIYLCAGSVSPDKGRDSCFGDSGGPLVWQDPQVAGDSDFGLRLVGLVSFGEGCAGALPGVYTEVANYQDWIQEEGGAVAQTQPVFEMNPFEADFGDAGAGLVAAGSSSGGSGNGGSGGNMGWWTMLGLILAGFMRCNISRFTVSREQG